MHSGEIECSVLRSVSSSCEISDGGKIEPSIHIEEDRQKSGNTIKCSIAEEVDKKESGEGDKKADSEISEFANWEVHPVNKNII